MSMMFKISKINTHYYFKLVFILVTKLLLQYLFVIYTVPIGTIQAILHFPY